LVSAFDDRAMWAKHFLIFYKSQTQKGLVQPINVSLESKVLRKANVP